MRLPLLLLLPCLLCVAACGGADQSSAPTESSDAPLAEQFLDTYVGQDGQVVRHDQGGDVVSEGQAYGLLVAELAGRDDLVRAIWGWTKQHLLGDDGLLAWHARADGTVLDSQPASDADVLAAYALLRYDGEGADAVRSDGKSLAAAVLQHEVVDDAAGRPVLAAGPWAVGAGVVNPSYLMPGVFDDLASLTGDDTWSALAHSASALVNGVTGGGRTLPPDWARLDGSGLVATGGADGHTGSPQYGPDAQRVPLWFAASCAAADRRLAGRWWAILQQDDRSSALALTPAGDVVDATGEPLALLAAAATATADGDTSGAADLRRGALEAARGTPTYYGDAWLALAGGLDAGTFSACP